MCLDSKPLQRKVACVSGDGVLDILSSQGGFAALTLRVEARVYKSNVGQLSHVHSLSCVLFLPYRRSKKCHGS